MGLRVLGLLNPGPLPCTSVPKSFTDHAPVMPLELPCHLLWVSLRQHDVPVPRNGLRKVAEGVAENRTIRPLAICLQGGLPDVACPGEGKPGLTEFPLPISPLTHEDAAGEIPGAVKLSSSPSSATSSCPFPSLSLHMKIETARIERGGPSRVRF